MKDLFSSSIYSEVIATVLFFFVVVVLLIFFLNSLNVLESLSFSVIKFVLIKLLSNEFKDFLFYSTDKVGSNPPDFLNVDKKSLYSNPDLVVFLKKISKFLDDLVPLKPVDPIVLTNLSTDFSFAFNLAASYIYGLFL